MFDSFFLCEKRELKNDVKPVLCSCGNKVKKGEKTKKESQNLNNSSNICCFLFKLNVVEIFSSKKKASFFTHMYQHYLFIFKIHFSD